MMCNVVAGATEVLAHVHVQNDAARALYARFGFTAPQLDASRQDGFARASDRMRGLLLLRAPLPLARRSRAATATDCDCGALDWGLQCVCP